MRHTGLNRGASGCYAVFASLMLVSSLAACIATKKSPISTFQPAVETKTTSATQTSQAAFPLSGTWSGTAKNGTFVMQATITIQRSCQVGDVCGTFDLSIPCSGTFALIAQEGDVYEFRAGDKMGSCGTGRDFLQLLPDGTLQYVSRGDYGETIGILAPANLLPSFASSQIPLIYDDDGSPDGTSALLYLLTHSDIDLKAVGISYGEAHPTIYIQHIGRMLDDLGVSGIPLGAGQDSSLSGDDGFPEWLRQSADDFWGWTIPNTDRTYPVHDSADLIISIVKQSPQPVTLFFSGPLTNLARALRLSPEITENIAALYLMGGAVDTPGNIHDFYPESKNTYAEWNIYSDPLAAKEVFESGMEIYLVPLDATNQVVISKQDTVQWRAGGRTADFAADIYDWLMDTTGRQSTMIWDLMTAEIMLDPGLCTFQERSLEVITAVGNTHGQTAVVPGAAANVHVCLLPDATLIRQTLIDDFSQSP